MKDYHYIKQKIISVCILLSFIFCSCASVPKDNVNTAPEPYNKEEIPLWLQNVRRTEIITFGSIPFVTFQVTFAYSLYRFFNKNMDTAYIPNPFAKDSTTANLNSQEQLNILKYSLIISGGIGLTDLIINIVKQQISKSRQRKQNELSKNIIVTPVEDSIKLDLPTPKQEDEKDAVSNSGN